MTDKPTDKTDKKPLTLAEVFAKHGINVKETANGYVIKEKKND